MTNDKCEHGVAWSMECLSCGPSDYARVDPPAAPTKDDADDLHLAICQAVHLMNQGDLHAGHDLLRQTLVDLADKKTPLSRSEIVRRQQRTGSGEVMAVMVSPITPPAPDEAVAESIAEPWICVEEKPCEETVAVHWEELLTAFAAALAQARKEAARQTRQGDAEFFCHWLLRAYEAIHRDTSYEEGESLDNLARELNQVIGFAGYEPESVARAELLKKEFSWTRE